MLPKYVVQKLFTVLFGCIEQNSLFFTPEMVLSSPSSSSNAQ